MRAEFAKALGEALEFFGEEVRITTASGEITLFAVIDSELDEYGIDQEFAILADGAWADDSPSFLQRGAKRYKIADIRRLYGDVWLKLESAR